MFPHSIPKFVMAAQASAHSVATTQSLPGRPAGIHKVYNLLFRFTRKRRMRRFETVLRPTAELQILDVGGSVYNWKYLSIRPRLVLLNLEFDAEDRVETDRTTLVQGDARDLPYAEGEFAILHSNSVIKHVGEFADQQQFANEARRVGRQLWIQTPARCFPIEPHYLTPFVHWLSKRWQKAMLRRCSLWGWLQRPSRQEIDGMVDQTRLLSKAELRQLFPDCEILTERFCLIPRSYIAVRRERAQHQE